MDLGVNDSSREQLIADYLARNRVTKCPSGIPRGAPQSGRFNPNASSRRAKRHGGNHPASLKDQSESHSSTA